VFLARELNKEDTVRLNVYQRLTEEKDFRIAEFLELKSDLRMAPFSNVE
jgi:hypothetical protein